MYASPIPGYMYPRYSYEIQDSWHSTEACLNEISPQISDEASSKKFTELRVFNQYPRYSYEIQGSRTAIAEKNAGDG